MYFNGPVSAEKIPKEQILGLEISPSHIVRHRNILENPSTKNVLVQGYSARKYINVVISNFKKKNPPKILIDFLS